MPTYESVMAAWEAEKPKLERFVRATDSVFSFGVYLGEWRGPIDAGSVRQDESVKALFNALNLVSYDEELIKRNLRELPVTVVPGLRSYYWRALSELSRTGSHVRLFYEYGPVGLIARKFTGAKLIHSGRDNYDKKAHALFKRIAEAGPACACVFLSIVLEKPAKRIAEQIISEIEIILRDWEKALHGEDFLPKCVTADTTKSRMKKDMQSAYSERIEKAASDIEKNLLTNLKSLQTSRWNAIRGGEPELAKDLQNEIDNKLSELNKLKNSKKKV